MSRMIEVPEECQGLVKAVQNVFAQVKGCLSRAQGGRSLNYGQVEREIAERVAEIEKAAHQVILERLDVDEPRVLIRGKEHARVGRYPATYYTMAGPVEVDRSLYRAAGDRNGPTVDAISLRVGVVEQGWLPETAKAKAFLMQQGTSREAEDTARSQCRLPYSRSSFERVGHGVGALYVQNNVDVEQKLIEVYQVPTEAAGVSVSIDRVSLPMEEPHPSPPPRAPTDKPKKDIVVNYRMAYCGTVTVHDEEGRALHTLRYGRMPKGDAVGLCEGLASDVDMMRKQRPDLKVTLLCDGAPEMWDLLDEQLNKVTLQTEVVRLVDMWHLVEKLGKAARLMFGENEGAEREVTRWKLRLLNDSDAADAIKAELMASPKRSIRAGAERPIQEAITYIENHRDRMDYAAARRQGRPVGSGAVEATCKSLVSVRMKRAGSRWKEFTGEDILQLRALGLSDRWDDAMRFTLAPLRTAVQRAA
jgi:hypothetical protein